ncbi:integral membrane TerC family protein, partial [Vibrio parahaemolyticus V-223/04]
YLLSKLF